MTPPISRHRAGRGPSLASSLCPVDHTLSHGKKIDHHRRSFFTRNLSLSATLGKSTHVEVFPTHFARPHLGKWAIGHTQRGAGGNLGPFSNKGWSPDAGDLVDCRNMHKNCVSHSFGAKMGIKSLAFQKNNHRSGLAVC